LNTQRGGNLAPILVAGVAIAIAGAALAISYYNSAPGRARSSQSWVFYLVTPEESFNETIVGIPHYIFSPTQITVSQGDSILIHFYNTADDTHHTFTLAAYQINVDLAPGQHQDIKFVATQSGVFSYGCTFHPATMRGELTVLPA